MATNFVTIPVQSTIKKHDNVAKCKVSCDAIADDNG